MIELAEKPLSLSSLPKNMKNCPMSYIIRTAARVAELADAPGLGPGPGNGMRVRVPPLAFTASRRWSACSASG